MPRTYILQSWSDAAEFDVGDTYSGEQVGNRASRSVGVHINRSGDQWTANVSAYSDAAIASRKQQASEPCLFSELLPAEAKIAKIEQKMLRLDREYLSGKFDAEHYMLLSSILESQYCAAWRELEKCAGWIDIPIELDYSVHREQDAAEQTQASVVQKTNKSEILNFFKFLLDALRKRKQNGATTKQKDSKK